MPARNLDLIACALFAAVSSLPAQSPRISITPTFGWIWPSPIYEYQANLAGTGPQSVTIHQYQRLWVKPTRTLGGKIDVTVGRGWSLFAAGGATPRTRVDFIDSTQYVISKWWDEARIKNWSAGIGKSFQGPSGFPELRVTAGAGTYRFQLNRSSICFGPGACFAAPPWSTHYNVTSLVGGLSVRQTVAAHFALDLSTTGSIGKAKTENFFVDFIPGFDQYEPPKSHRVRTAQAALGITLF